LHSGLLASARRIKADASNNAFTITYFHYVPLYWHSIRFDIWIQHINTVARHPVWFISLQHSNYKWYTTHFVAHLLCGISWYLFLLCALYWCSTRLILDSSYQYLGETSYLVHFITASSYKYNTIQFYSIVMHYYVASVDTCFHYVYCTGVQ